MDFFSRLSRTGADAEPTDLSEVRADDALIEALRGVPLFEAPGAPSDDEAYGAHSAELSSGSTRVTATDTDAQVLQLLKSWRTEIDSIPLPPPIDLEIAAAIVRTAPPRRRTVRPMLAVTAAIAALLLGSAAIGSRSATPDSFLFPVTQLLWGDRADSMLAGIDAREGIAKANEALDAGHPEAAGEALNHVTSVITKVEDRDGRQTLESDYQQVKQQLESVSTITQTPSTMPVTTSPVQVPPTSDASQPPVGLPTETSEPVAPNTDSTEAQPTTTPSDQTSPDTSPPEEPSTTPTEPTESPSSETPTTSTETTPTVSSTPTSSDQDADHNTVDGDEQQGLVGKQAPADNVSEQTSDAATP
jgi:hypothetical protein